jgi:Fe2+ transport system protein B
MRRQQDSQIQDPNSSNQPQQEGEEEEIEVHESRISKTLSERTTKIVIILVLLMLFFQPVFTVDTYVDTPPATDQGLKHLVDVFQSGNWTSY